jgi:hypothetical protein
MNNKASFYEDNMTINMNVIKMCHLFGVKRLICCLSTCIFPDEIVYPIEEKDLQYDCFNDVIVLDHHILQMRDMPMLNECARFNAEFTMSNLEQIIYASFQLIYMASMMNTTLREVMSCLLSLGKPTNLKKPPKI